MRNHVHHFVNKTAMAMLLAGIVVTVHAGVQPPAGDEMVSELIVKFKSPVKSKSQGATMAAQTSNNVSDRLNSLIQRVKNERAGAVLLKRSSNSRIASAAEAAEDMMVMKSAIDKDTGVVALGRPLSRVEFTELKNAFANDPTVQYAVANERMYPSITPNDPGYKEQWGYSAPTEQIKGGANLPLAWDYTKGNDSVVVAVIDTGYRPHVDLQPNLLPGYDFISNLLRANRGSLPLDGKDPGDWVTDAENLSGPYRGCGAGKSSWHGTHVAGTIAAVSDNGLGVAGVASKSKILPLRALGKCGGDLADITKAMKWAVGLEVVGVPKNPHPAKVLNLSLGGGGACSEDYIEAIKQVKATGATIVVAAGNAGDWTANSQPANCEGVIAVGATGKDGDRAYVLDGNGKPVYFSNFGPEVKIAAPGATILSTLNMGTEGPKEDAYAYSNGTSMAAPHVAGTVALMLSMEPKLTDADIVAILQSSAKSFPVGSYCLAEQQKELQRKPGDEPRQICGAGLLDAGEAIKQVKLRENLSRLN